MSNTCNYVLASGQKCGRESEHTYCIFHTPRNDLNRKPDYLLRRQLVKLIKNRDGNWEGFIFPKKLSLKNRTFDFPFYLNSSELGSLDIEGLSFKGNIEAKSSLIEGAINVNKCDCVNIDFNDSKFVKEVKFNQLTVSSSYSVLNCEFLERFEIRGRLNGVSTFNGSHFHSKAVFSQYRNVAIALEGITIQTTANSAYIELSNPDWSIWKRTFEKLKKYKWRIQEWLKKKHVEFKRRSKSLSKSVFNKVKVQTSKIRKRFPYDEQGVDESHLFYGQVNFANVVFEKPASVSFLHVNLIRTSFENTDLKNVYFTGCNWYQKELKRNGIEQEYRNDSSDYHSRRLFLPRIESTCRNIRHALEDNKDFALANDFFIGEMEAKRKQLPFLKREFFSLLAWYRAVSNYGTSPWVCLRFIVLVGLTHALLVLPHIEEYKNVNTILYAETSNYWETLNVWSKSIWSHIVELPKTMVYSFQVMTLQKVKIITLTATSETLNVLNFIASIIGPALTLFLGLCVRTRIKRT